MTGRTTVAPTARTTVAPAGRTTLVQRERTTVARSGRTAARPGRTTAAPAGRTAVVQRERTTAPAAGTTVVPAGSTAFAESGGVAVVQAGSATPAQARPAAAAESGGAAVVQVGPAGSAEGGGAAVVQVGPAAAAEEGGTTAAEAGGTTAAEVGPAAAVESGGAAVGQAGSATAAEVGVGSEAGTLQDSDAGARIARLARLAGARAQRADVRRRLDADVVAEMGRAGFNRHFVPIEHGGTAGSFTSLTAAAARVGERCTSAAWVATLFAAHGRIAAYLPEPARHELWHASPDVRIAAGVAPPVVRARAVPGGWALAGEWPSVSGADFADWVLLAALAEEPGGAVSRLFLVPADDCTVLDTWHPLGMRGTGSNTVRLDGVRVPAHRTVAREALLRPRAADAARCHSVPYPLVAALMFAAPLVGAARGALADWIGSAPTCDRTEDVLARSSGELRAAELLVRAAAERADSGGVEPLAVAENVRDVVAAVELCGAAADRLFKTGGTRVQAADDPVQRRRRDIEAGASHAMLRFGPSARSYARAVWGA
ncbi:hypothetical protein AB0L59_14275 [Streptomyces sp. NPDC052109]|uniref:hypothetical protein n=1 Tax=Streptomyces sp. NPDC052109 TaxID=3155527 RepID=UPI003449C78B